MTTKKKEATRKGKKKAKKLTAIRIDPELWDEAQKLAEMQGTSATGILTQCLKISLPMLRNSMEKLYAGTSEKSLSAKK